MGEDLNEDLLDYIIKTAAKLGADYTDARLERYVGDGCSLKNGIPEGLGFDEIKGISARVLIKGAMGFVTLDTLNKNKIREALENTIKTTSYMAKSTKLKTQMSEEKIHKSSYKIKPKISGQDISPADKISVLKDMHSILKNSKINIPSTYFALESIDIQKLFKNSEGTRVSASMPFIELFYTATVKENQKTAQRFFQLINTKGWEAIGEWKPTDRILAEATALRDNLRNAVKAPKSSHLDVVAGPEIVGIMVHESVGHPYEADRILGREAAQAGESFIKPKDLGIKIGSDIVTVHDDPTIPYSAGFYKYDDEGVKARPKVLIKNGVIKEFLHNRQTAAIFNTKSNGGARSSDVAKEPIVRMSNTYMLPGNHTEEELIEDIKLGIYMKNYTEWNIDDKRLHQKYVGNEAYLIKNGKIVGPVRRPVIEISTTELYKAIDAVGKKVEYSGGTCGKGEPMQGVPVWFGGPAVRIRRACCSI